MLDRALEDTLPYLFALLGIVEGDDPLAQMDAQIAAPHARCDQAHPAAREPQPAADGDLRGPALDRRRDAGVPESARRLDRDREDPAAGQLSARVLASVGQQDLLHAACGSIRSARRAPTRCSPRCSANGANSQPLKRLIIERTEGNPFFMEETVQVLFDEGALVRDGGRSGSRSRSAN